MNNESPTPTYCRGFVGTKQFELKEILSMAWNHCMTCPTLNTPRRYDKKSCLKKPRASIPDFLTLFNKKLKSLAWQRATLVVQSVTVNHIIIHVLSCGGAGETGHSSISFSFFHSWHSDPGAVSLHTGFCYSLKLDGSRIYK